MTPRPRGRVGASAVIAASVIAAVTIAWARKGASAPDAGVPPAVRPLFYDRPIAALGPDLDGDGAPEAIVHFTWRPC